MSLVGFDHCSCKNIILIIINDYIHIYIYNIYLMRILQKRDRFCGINFINHYRFTPPKTNMEPKNGGLENDGLFQ